MAISATELMLHHHHLHRLSGQQCRELSSDIHFLRSVEQSMGLNQLTAPAIIISASGMATGGRVLHHLKRMLVDSRNSIIFAGYQAGGSRGARLVEGQKSIKIHGHYYPVKAQINNLDFLSAHADQQEILAWLQRIPVAPKRCFITHGEAAAADQLRLQIEEKLGWPAEVAELNNTVKL